MAGPEGGARHSRAGPASRITLPSLDAPPATMLAFLEARFPRIPDWESRMARGLVRAEGGAALEAGSPYRAGLRVLYFREVDQEPAVPLDAAILYQDDRLLVADKPHFLPVTPTGPYVRASLLAVLQERTGLPNLAPLHRLDLETAGLVLFSVRPGTRGAYHALFSQGLITKTYHAVSAEVPGAAEHGPRTWRVENRIEQGDPFFRMAIVEGPVNAKSTLRLLAEGSGRGLFEIRPETGKKHQVRLHMAAIGRPVLHDRLYPALQPGKEPDFDHPLQLLARRLEFVDPVSGETRIFESRRELAWSPGLEKL